MDDKKHFLEARSEPAGLPLKIKLNLLRQIPVEKVLKALGKEPVAERAGKPIKNAFDVCLWAGMDYGEAQRSLAAKFPAALKEGASTSILEQKVEMMMRETSIPEKYKENAHELARTMAALRAEKITITTGVMMDGKLKNAKSFGTLDFRGVAKALPGIYHDCERKVPRMAPRHPFFEPVYPRDKACICVSDDATSPIQDRYPPNAIIKSGFDRFFIYVLAKKCGKKFYDYLNDMLQDIYKAARKLIPLPLNGDGKSELIGYSWERAAEMERFADNMRKKWKEVGTIHEKLDLTVPVSEIGKDSEWRKLNRGDAAKPVPQGMEILDPSRDCAKARIPAKTPAKEDKDTPID